MQLIAVTIQGKTPLICNRFTDEAQLAATSGTRSVAVGDKGTPHDQASKKLYRNDKTGELVIPAQNVFRSIIDAGIFHKNGKSKITTQKSSLVPACVAIVELLLPITSPHEWEVDTRPVRIPSTGGRILTHRPKFEDWELSFTLELDDSQMTIKLLRDLVDDAGKRIGLGDFRPACKGPYGRFVVTAWNVV